MSKGGHERQADRFRPLRPAPRTRLIAAAVVGPLLWVIAVVAVAAVLRRSDMIQLGLVVALVSFVVSVAVLALLRHLRERERARCVDAA